MTGGTTLPGDCSDSGLFEETPEIDFSGTDKFGVAMANQSRQEYVQVTLGLILSENRLCHCIRNPVRERMEPLLSCLLSNNATALRKSGTQAGSVA